MCNLSSDFKLIQQSLVEPESTWEALVSYDVIRKIMNVIKKTDKFRLLLDEDRKDILSESIKKCYIDRFKFEGRSLFSTWMCSYAKNITYNYCSKLIRHNKNSYIFESKAFLEMYHNNPLYVVISTERSTCLWAALGFLPKNSQQIVYKYILEGKSLTSIGREMGETYKFTKSQYQLAVKMLKKKFKALYYSKYYFNL